MRKIIILFCCILCLMMNIKTYASDNMKWRDYDSVQSEHTSFEGGQIDLSDILKEENKNDVIPIRENEYLEHSSIDVSKYLGMTIGEALKDFPDFYIDNDATGSGRYFYTNGKVSFFCEYNYSSDGIDEDSIINRVVLYGNCGSDYSIGQLPGGATRGDEYVSLNEMGYDFLWRTEDERHFWRDNAGHLLIITQGQWAGACEIDYSFIESESYYD